MKTRFKKITAFFVLAAMLMTAAPYNLQVHAGTKDVRSGENEAGTLVKVSVKAEDYTAAASGVEGASKTGVIADMEVSAESAADAIEKALTAAGVDYDMSKGYVSEVNGLSLSDGYSMSGWMLAYNNDDCDNWGLDYINVKDGDTLNLIYTLDGGTDIASASSGLPTLKTLEIAGVKYSFQTITEYDANWNASYTYKVNGEQLEGSGTNDNPFVIDCSAAPEYKDGKITYSYTTYANENYVSVEAEDYMNPDADNEIIVTSRGGRKAYYKIAVSTKEQPTGTPEPTATPDPTETPEPTATPEPTGTPEPTATPLPDTTEPVHVNPPVQTAQPSPAPTEVPVKTPDIQPEAPGKAKVKSLKFSGNKLKVTVKKVKGAKGYKITAASDKAFKKNKKVKNTAKTGITFSKCTKKRYYVKAQAYVTDAAGKKIYGRESRAVMIKQK